MSAPYTAGLTSMMTGGVDLSSDDIRCVLLTSGYTFNAAHDYLNDISASYRLATFTLTSKAVAAAVWDAANGVWPAVAAGSTGVAATLYVYNASESAALLLFHITGIEAIGNGSDVACDWSANGIVRLS